jgi:hypothetical protein
MYQALDFAIAFCITVSLLSSVILALTLIYVSRLKPRKEVKNKIKAQEPGPGEEAKLESIEAGVRSETRNLAADAHTPVNLAEQKNKIDVSSKVADPSETAISHEIPSEGTPKDQRVGSNQDTRSENADTSPKPDVAKEKGRAQVEPLEIKDPSAIKTVNVNVAQATMAPPSPLEMKEPPAGLTGPDTKQMANHEHAGGGSAPSIKVINENEVKDKMADIPKEDPPADMKQDMSFSDLFTEDTEETEADKLGKQLGDIDAGDIVKMTQSLADQLKGKRLAVK